MGHQAGLRRGGGVRRHGERPFRGSSGRDPAGVRGLRGPGRAANAGDRHRSEDKMARGRPCRSTAPRRCPEGHRLLGAGRGVGRAPRRGLRRRALLHRHPQAHGSDLEAGALGGRRRLGNRRVPCWGSAAVIGSSSVVLANLAYLIGAVVLAVIGGTFVWLRHRQPKSVDANVASFTRGLRALAPDSEPVHHLPEVEVPETPRTQPRASGLRIIRTEPEPGDPAQDTTGQEHSGHQLPGQQLPGTVEDAGQPAGAESG